MGGSSRDSIADTAKMASEQIKMTFNGELPTNLVNCPENKQKDLRGCLGQSDMNSNQ